MPAQATAKSVIASAARLMPVRHCWRKRKRTAEMSVPAWPMPIQKTKLMMNEPQPTGWFTPSDAHAGVEERDQREDEDAEERERDAERDPPPLRGELLGVHADVAVDVGPLLPAGDERLGDLEVAPVGAGPREDDRPAGELAVVHHRGVGTRLMPCHGAPSSDRRWTA